MNNHHGGTQNMTTYFFVDDDGSGVVVTAQEIRDRFADLMERIDQDPATGSDLAEALPLEITAQIIADGFGANLCAPMAETTVDILSRYPKLDDDTFNNIDHHVARFEVPWPPVATPEAMAAAKQFVQAVITQDRDAVRQATDQIATLDEDMARLGAVQTVFVLCATLIGVAKGY